MRLRPRERVLAVGQQRFELTSLSRERRQRRDHSLAGLLQRATMRLETSGLGIRLRQLAREPLRPSSQLRMPLAQLACLPHEVGTLSGDSDLLEAQRFDAVTLGRKILTMPIERGL